jgi:hypothetical protein
MELHCGGLDDPHAVGLMLVRVAEEARWSQPRLLDTVGGVYPRRHQG